MLLKECICTGICEAHHPQACYSRVTTCRRECNAAATIQDASLQRQITTIHIYMPICSPCHVHREHKISSSAEYTSAPLL